jgi:pyruvate-ferredoxin/flavodoxin oxidoreductase
VLDTQVYSNTGGQSCTSGFTGQVADMAGYGSAQHGKTEARKELSLIALAHRGAYVMQASQALPSHMMEGIIRGLKTRRPAVFNIYTPCPVEHGTPDEWAPTAARMALESRAFPIMIFDPDAGDSLAECIELDGNPALDDVWPTYELSYVDDEGQDAVMELPVTTADWAATEGRFAKHFKRLSRDDWSDDMVLFHEFIALSTEERSDAIPFVWVLGEGRRLERLRVSPEIVLLADDRLEFWSLLKEMAGLEVSEEVRDRVSESLDAEFEVKAAAIRAEYEAKLVELKTTYPRLIARRMAEGLVGSGNGARTVNEILAEAASTPGLEPVGPTAMSVDLGGGAGAAVAVEAPSAVVEAPVAAPGAGAPEAEEAEAASTAAEPADDTLAIEPYIDTEMCTTCNECTDLNRKMFAYDKNKQAYIKDATAGKFSDLVKAAERCPAEIIHPGTPLNPKEKDLDKWIARAEKFN